MVISFRSPPSRGGAQVPALRKILGSLSQMASLSQLASLSQQGFTLPARLCLGLQDSAVPAGKGERKDFLSRPPRHPPTFPASAGFSECPHGLLQTLLPCREGKGDRAAPRPGATSPQPDWALPEALLCPSELGVGREGMVLKGRQLQAAWSSHAMKGVL